MVQIIAGRAGSGKSSYCTERIGELAQYGCEKIIIVVPEQFTFSKEQEIVGSLGNMLAARVEVLSFSRLPAFIYDITGGGAKEYITDSGRCVLMNSALEAVRTQLKVYGKASLHPEFIDTLLGFAAELKDYGVGFDHWQAAAESVKSEKLQDKLHDLALILEGYTALVGERFADRMDDLFTAADKLTEGEVFAGYEVFFDSFKSFTPSQYALLEKILLQSKNVTVTLCSDNLEDTGGLSLFATGNATYRALKRLCKRLNIEIASPRYLGQKNDSFSADIAAIERYVYAPPPEKKLKNPSNVEIYCAADPYAEVDFVARKILRMTREEGMRFRSFAVIARDLTRYSSVVEAVFGKYGIPVFVDRKSETLAKPIAALVFSAFDAVLSGFSYANIFSYLKSGITDLTQDEIDILENYVYVWNIRGRQWTSTEDWTFHPDGFNREFRLETEEQLKQINEIRRKALAPLEQFMKDIQTADAVKLSEAVFALLVRLGVPERVEELAAKLHGSGKRSLALEYEQLWNTLMETLEQIALTVREPISAQRYAALLKLVLSKTSIGSVPATVDQVLFGSADRLRTHDISCTILLGVNEGDFPRAEFEAGLLSDSEKQELTSFGIELSPTTEKQLFEERFFVYCAFTSAKDKIILTYPKTDAAGKAKNPSYIIQSLRRIFDGLETIYLDELELTDRYTRVEMIVDKRSAFEYMLRKSGERDAIAAAAEEYFEGDVYYKARGEDLRKTVAQLTGDAKLTNIQLSERLFSSRRQSPSSLEKFAKCQFSYFCEYGLKLKPREKLDFDSTEIGTFTHYVVEKYLKEYRTPETDVPDDEKIKEIIQRYIVERLPDFDGRSARFRVLFRRLSVIVTTYIKSLSEELANSDFIPMLFEMRIGEDGMVKPYTIDGANVSVSGMVDRVDGLEKDGKLYLKIVDYKTYSKKFELSEVYGGLGLQMLMYLFALWQGGSEAFGKEIIPAGVVYSPITLRFDTAVDRQTTEEETEELRRKNAKGTGLLVDDIDVLLAMDKTGAFKYLPIKLKADKDGCAMITDKSSVASLERLGKLQSYTANKLRELAGIMRKGEIAINPYKPSTPAKVDSCAYCKMAEVCRIEKGASGVRELDKLSAEEFWSRVEGGEGNG